MLRLQCLADDFAAALAAADKLRPVARNLRTNEAFQAGIGPHSESLAIELAVIELRRSHPARYEKTDFAVPYPAKPRQRCDFAFGGPDDRIFVEAKLLRLLGDNGKPNDNMLMHILSPYPQHRSAVTDCDKLRSSRFPGRKAVLIFGYSYPDWPLEPAIDAFEFTSRHRGDLGPRHQAPFESPCHPIHSAGAAFVWEIL
jgi:hypothetical protein